MQTLESLLKGLYWKSNENGCWLITNLLPNHDGYIRLRYKNKHIYLHRLAFCIVNKLDYYDKSFQVNHKPECHNEACFNPNHLYKGDHQDNMIDRTKRITHCPKGHEFNKDNPKHHKGCRICYKLYMKEYYQNNKSNWNKSRRINAQP